MTSLEMMGLFAAMLAKMPVTFRDLNGKSHSGTPVGIEAEGGANLWNVRYLIHSEYKTTCIRG